MRVFKPIRTMEALKVKSEKSNNTLDYNRYNTKSYILTLLRSVLTDANKSAYIEISQQSLAMVVDLFNSPEFSNYDIEQMRDDSCIFCFKLKEKELSLD